MTPAQHTDLIERCKALGELLRLHEAAIAEDAAFMDDLRAQLATAQAENARLREALESLVRDVADYEAWQRPCLALDRARAALAAMGVGR